MGKTARMVIPIHDRNPVLRTPVVTYTLIAINFVVFLLEPIHHFAVLHHGTAATVCGQYRFFDHYAAIPHELITNEPERHAYVNAFGRIVCAHYFPHKIPALSVLTSMFLHGSWLHILGNMLFLYVFGNNVEDRFGRFRFLLFYLVSGYVAAYGFALAFRNSDTPIIGASGAIAGVLGAYLILSPRARVTSLVPFLFFIPLPLPAWLVLGGWFLLQWFYATGSAVAQGSGVAYLAHVIGFAFGVIVTAWLKPRLRPPIGRYGRTPYRSLAI
jgi:membrane associated rhomboid family serine protease|nr:rhomboid family intramembrane serine protease [Acidothermus cellulolyticus]